MAEKSFKKTILLTGAGFTANFGGLLSREMWSKILNNPKISRLPEIKKLLMGNFDFEDVYSQVTNGDKFQVDEKSLFQEIILEGYEAMDETLKQFCYSGFNQYGIWWGGVSQFLGSFSGTQNEPGIHFTLNQDLLLERAVKRQQLGITAVRYREHWDAISLGQIDLKKPIVLPDEAGLADFKDKHLSSVGDMYYIKLHGSQGWLSYTGKNQMVLGTNKFEDIKKEPLLNWYFQLFENAIYRNDVNLFVIGYSFRDAHVNDCLIKAIEEYNLKLIIISPENPEDFKSRMEGRPSQSGLAWQVSNNVKIWNAVSGYFPYKLKDIFPDQTDTHIIKDIRRLII